MQKSTNYGLNLPDLADQFNLNHWNENTEKLDFELKNETDLLRNDLNSINDAIVNLTNSTLKTSLLNFCYPIGSLYWSSKDTNPATLFGGTWVQIKDKFILACGDTYINGATGGSSTVNLTIEQIPSHTHTGPSHTHTGPSHTHSFTPSGSVSAHVHGLDNHTHSFTPKGTIASTFKGTTVSGKANVEVAEAYKPSTSGVFTSTDLNDKTVGDNAGTYHDQYTLNFSMTPSGTVTSTFTGTAGTTGGSTANTGIGTPKFTGTAGTTESAGTGNTGASGTGNTGSAGGGQAHNNMPPYVVKYCWERVS